MTAQLSQTVPLLACLEVICELWCHCCSRF